MKEKLMTKMLCRDSERHLIKQKNDEILNFDSQFFSVKIYFMSQR
jgi:hypothetical protein